MNSSDVRSPVQPGADPKNFFELFFIERLSGLDAFDVHMVDHAVNASGSEPARH